MPIESIDRPNPPPAASHLPPVVDELRVSPKKSALSDDACKALDRYRRAANYIAAGESKVTC